MRLWHEALIPYLPRQQLLGLHREVCALRGNGWGKPHSVVNYVFEHPYGWLVSYHFRVINEMERRGYCVDRNWCNGACRGKKCDPVSDKKQLLKDLLSAYGKPVYPEHNAEYLQECLDNLAGKGIQINMEVQNASDL